MRSGSSMADNTMLNMLTLSNKKNISKTIKKLKNPGGKKQSFNYSVTNKFQDDKNTSENGDNSFTITSGRNSKLVNSDLVPAQNDNILLTSPRQVYREVR